MAAYSCCFPCSSRPSTSKTPKNVEFSDLSPRLTREPFAAFCLNVFEYLVPTYIFVFYVPNIFYGKSVNETKNRASCDGFSIQWQSVSYIAATYGGKRNEAHTVADYGIRSV